MMCRVILKRLLVVCLLPYLIFLSSGPVAASPQEKQNLFELQEMDERQTGFFSMKDLENKKVIMRTARFIRPGDEYINSQNKLYRVEKVEGNTAWASYQEDVQLFEGGVEAILESVSPGGSIPSEKTVLQESRAGTNVPRFGVYHSHGAESYVPSDGTDSIMEGGGILEVGRTLVEALREKGFEVRYSTKTHVPHDAGAYNRSRRTVEHFLHQGVRTIFDIHRDAVPAEEYTAEVENKPTVQVQIVVGQQNQNVQSNRNFAEGLKKVADGVHPGLVKGIFMASGSYNQDILPLALLFEVGSHENTREGAAHSMELFSDAIKVYFLGAPAGPVRSSWGLTALRSILWIVFVAGLALGVYLLIGTGGLVELRAKLRHFFSREFAEFGLKRKGGGGSEEGSGEGDNE